MGTKLKEDERNERTIRALLKRSENRRCINCGSLGPQYVCTTFSIFVCTNCSGLHREFSHRIKSVSMAKFTAEEVRNLQAGGNERARELFLKDYDLQRNPLPDSSHADKLRDFIKSVYVERRYTGDRPPPKGRLGDRDDLYEARRPELRPDSRLDVQSLPFEDQHDDRRFVERRRSDVDRGRYDDRKFDDRKFGDRVVHFEEKKIPGRFEPDRSRYDPKNQFNDRRHEDKIWYDERERDRRSSYDDRFVSDIRHDRHRSADDQLSVKGLDGDSPPVRPVTEILGDNVPALWVEVYHHTNGRGEDQSSHASPAEQRRDMRIPRLGSFGTANGSASVSTSAVIKRVNSGSLIDFSAEPEPSAVATPASDPFGVSLVVVPQSTADSTSSTGWATFDTVPAGTAILPAEGPPVGYPDVLLAPSNGGQWAMTGWHSSDAPSIPATDNWSSLVGSSMQQPVMGVGSQVLQAWKSFPPASSEPALHSDFLQLLPELLHEQPKSTSGLPTASSVDRSRELPKDLFAHSFATVSMPAGGLGVGQQIPGFAPAGHTFGLGAMPTYAQPLRSRNPFDLPGDGAPSTGIGHFPSLGSLQAALPIGPLSVPASVAPFSSNHWSMGLQPASYPPTGPAGGSGSAFAAQLGVTPASVLEEQTTGPFVGSSVSENFNSGELFAAGSSLLGLGSSEFPTHNFLQTFSGNPFG